MNIDDILNQDNKEEVFEIAKKVKRTFPVSSANALHYAKLKTALRNKIELYDVSYGELVVYSILSSVKENFSKIFEYQVAQTSAGLLNCSFLQISYSLDINIHDVTSNPLIVNDHPFIIIMDKNGNEIPVEKPEKPIMDVYLEEILPRFDEFIDDQEVLAHIPFIVFNGERYTLDEFSKEEVVKNTGIYDIVYEIHEEGRDAHFGQNLREMIETFSSNSNEKLNIPDEYRHTGLPYIAAFGPSPYDMFDRFKREGILGRLETQRHLAYAVNLWVKGCYEEAIEHERWLLNSSIERQETAVQEGRVKANIDGEIQKHQYLIKALVQNEKFLRENYDKITNWTP